MHSLIAVAIQEDKKVRDFWQSHTFSLPLRWNYRDWWIKVEKDRDLVPQKAEVIEGIPDHFLYPLSQGEFIFYEVKLLSLEANAFLVIVKQIVTAPEIIKILLPEIKKQLMQQSSLEEKATSQKIGQAIAAIVKSPQCKAVTWQLIKISLAIIATLSASFIPQFMPEVTDTFLAPTTQPTQHKSSQLPEAQ